MLSRRAVDALVDDAKADGRVYESDGDARRETPALAHRITMSSTWERSTASTCPRTTRACDALRRLGLAIHVDPAIVVRHHGIATPSEEVAMSETEKWSFPPEHQPDPRNAGFDLDRALSSVVALEARSPDDAMTARSLGTERTGSAVVIREDGLALTIGYLVTEADEACA